jgi:hypothetical protein
MPHKLFSQDILSFRKYGVCSVGTMDSSNTKVSSFEHHRPFLNRLELRHVNLRQFEHVIAEQANAQQPSLGHSSS